ncbi:enoyl-CoA hydratase/isomerase family protein [Fulvivirga sp. M361]|uniref:enoyl-CoA hydratase/isomerase family protein n=1 Tax=Fulvivirga sp. M361 TaxID=2594266 RepID=UPI00117BA9A2|nr:enoyl-CoA hydratase/isomerase family protein [Fulvivirga sp. M361]TRX48478.1 enoyl-CoA hydratase/isomerase family protein [Fulvivirga sp. M361]
MEAYVTRHDSPEGITEIEFFHPAHNSLPGTILKKLADTITSCGEDDSVSVIILKSGGDRTFCAGASFDELVHIDDFETGKKFFMGFAQVINACRRCPKLVIGRVQGKAVGGGVGIAATVDYCMATKFASVKLSELNVGIGPFVVGPAVERKIGLSAMSQMTINADNFYPAEWARSQGLFADVFEDITSLDTAVMKLAKYLVATNPEARSALKEVFWQGYEHWDRLLEERAAMSGKLVLSAFTKKALKNYK